MFLVALWRFVVWCVYVVCVVVCYSSTNRGSRASVTINRAIKNKSNLKWCLSIVVYSLVCFGGLFCVVKKRLSRICGQPYLTVGIVHGGLWCCLMGAHKVSYERAGTLNLERYIFHRCFSCAPFGAICGG